MISTEKLIKRAENNLFMSYDAQEYINLIYADDFTKKMVYRTFTHYNAAIVGYRQAIHCLLKEKEHENNFATFSK